MNDKERAKEIVKFLKELGEYGNFDLSVSENYQERWTNLVEGIMEICEDAQDYKKRLAGMTEALEEITTEPEGEDNYGDPCVGINVIKIAEQALKQYK